MILMNEFTKICLARVAKRSLHKSADKRAAAALKFAHAHAMFSGINPETLEHIMGAFGAARELHHP